MVYLVRGKNGVIIKQDWEGSKRCMNYIYGSIAKKYNTVAEASIAALEHLADITPPNVPLPTKVKMDEMITVHKLMKAAGLLDE